MKVEDAQEYGLGDYVFVSKKDWAVFEARLIAAEELAKEVASDCCCHIATTEAMEAYRAAGKGEECL